MTWYAWVIVALAAVSALLTVLNIGKPRSPISPPVAALIVVANALYIWAIFSLAAH